MATSISTPCERLEWDSTFWDCAIARVQGNTLDRESLHRIDSWCTREGIACLYFLAEIDDAETTRTAEDGGFRLVDVRVTLDTSIESAQSAATGEEGILVRPAITNDVPALETMARHNHRDSRFYYDGHFSRDGCDQLYETWIRRSVEGYADVVLVAELGGEPVGYISCHRDSARASGSIGLVGVSEFTRGRGVGRELVSHGLAWFGMQGTRMVSVVTQGRNTSAQRLYQRHGFATRSVQLWYHKWYA